MRFKTYLKESQFETDKGEIMEMLIKSGVTESYIKFEADGAVTLNAGGFYLSRRLVKNGRLPFRFHEVHGNFFIDGCNLTSLVGCPAKVYGDFKCDDNPELKSLKGGPKFVKSKYSARYTAITSLEGIAAFTEPNNASIDLSGCHKIKSVDCFKDLQGPVASIKFPDSQFTSLADADKAFTHGFVENGSLCLNFNNITEGGINLLMIPGLKDIWNNQGIPEPFQIIKANLGKDTAFDTQMELFDKGFDDFAI